MARVRGRGSEPPLVPSGPHGPILVEDGECVAMGDERGLKVARIIILMVKVMGREKRK